MRRRVFLLGALLALFPAALPAFAEGKPLPAQAVLDAAMKQAKASRKTILVHFGASW